MDYKDYTDNFTDTEVNTINNINFVIFFILVLMVGVLFVYSAFIKSSKHLDKIIWALAILYMILIIVNGILYAVYRNRKDDPKAKEQAKYIPLGGVIMGLLIIAAVIFGKKSIIKKFDLTGATAAAAATAGKYFNSDSTTTIIGETTSPMKLTNTN